MVGNHPTSTTGLLGVGSPARGIYRCDGDCVLRCFLLPEYLLFGPIPTATSDYDCGRWSVRRGLVPRQPRIVCGLWGDGVGGEQAQHPCHCAWICEPNCDFNPSCSSTHIFI